MKICMTGTHGTGKTTLVAMLGVFFSKFYSCIDDARYMPNADKMSPEDKTVTAFERRIKMFEENEDVLSDRYFTDTYAYARLLGMRDLADAALSEARRWMEDTVLVYVPIEFDFDRTDARQYDRGQIDYFVKQGLDYLSVDNELTGFKHFPTYTVVNGCELTRLRAILAEIENRGRQILVHGKRYHVNDRCEPLHVANRVDPSWFCSPVKPLNETSCGSEKRGTVTSETKHNKETVNNKCLNDKCNCGSAHPETHDNKMALKKVNYKKYEVRRLTRIDPKTGETHEAVQYEFPPDMPTEDILHEITSDLEMEIDNAQVPKGKTQKRKKKARVTKQETIEDPKDGGPDSKKRKD